MLLESLEAVLDAGGRLAYEDDLADTRRQLGEASFAKAWEERKDDDTRAASHRGDEQQCMKSRGRLTKHAAGIVGWQ